jgi:hypothetical protein
MFSKYEKNAYHHILEKNPVNMWHGNDNYSVYMLLRVNMNSHVLYTVKICYD